MKLADTGLKGKGMVTIQNYHKVQSLEEAYELNQKKGSTIIAGMLWTKMGSNTILNAIDISALGLDTIEEDDEQFIIGAMATLRQLELHEGLNNYTQNAVCEAVKSIVGVQFRNMATAGGSIWGRFGFSDVLTVFLAMDSYVELYKGGVIPLRDFVNMDYDRDILVRIIVKKNSGIFAYSSVRNQSTDFPVIACAAAKINDEYRFTVGARPGRAMLITDTEGCLTDGLNEENIKAFAKKAREIIPTDSNSRAGAEYRSRLIGVLCQRLFTEISEKEDQ